MTTCPYCQHAHTSVCGAHRVSLPPAVAVPPAAAPEAPPRSPMAEVARDEAVVEKVSRRNRRGRE